MGAALLGGCSSIGPARVGIDRSDYASTLRETNKEQMLLNIVAMRYGDAPLFLEISSVISQYTREGSVRADIPIAPPSGSSEGSLGGTILLRETPTVTYAPLSGDRFARSLLTPISPAVLLGLIESGWAIDQLFPATVKSINGVRNASRNPLFALRADPEFDRVVETMARLQRNRSLLLDVERGPDGQFSARAHVPRDLTADDEADFAYLVQALKLPGDRRGEFRLAFGDAQIAADTLTFGTRSLFEILLEMAQGVDVPASDADGRATTSAGAATSPPLVRIHSGAERPSDAHTAIRYRGHWFWIDGTDEQSKRMFLIAQVILSLNDTSTGVSAPAVTIPVG